MYQCNSPVKIRQDHGVYLHTNCKRCLPCRMRRQNEIATRIWLETQSTRLQGKSSTFITFTYSQEPESPSAMKTDLQLFLKRYRKNLGNVRYFCIGEAGPNTNRLHAHMMLFGHQCDTSRPIMLKGKLHYLDAALEKTWSLGGKQIGFCPACPATQETSRYLSRYGVKHQKEGEHLFTLRSRDPKIGLEGARWISKEVEKYGVEQVPGHLSFTTRKGKKVPMFLDYAMRTALKEELGMDGYRALDEALVRHWQENIYGPPDQRARRSSEVKASKALRDLNERYSI